MRKRKLVLPALPWFYRILISLRLAFSRCTECAVAVCTTKSALRFTDNTALDVAPAQVTAPSSEPLPGRCSPARTCLSSADIRAGGTQSTPTPSPSHWVKTWPEIPLGAPLLPGCCGGGQSIQMVKQSPQTDWTMWGKVVGDRDKQEQRQAIPGSFSSMPEP